MAQSGRPGSSAEQKRELWRRWRVGESLSETGRALGRQPGSIHGVAASGGYVPVPRRRSPRVLSLSEREEVSRGLAGGRSLRSIADRLGRAPSTVSREVARHGGRRRYRETRADDRAWRRARRPQSCKLAAQPRLRALVAEKIAEEWSPDQISGWLARTSAGAQTLPAQLRTSLTGHRGIELASRRRFSIATNVAVSFCDPQIPWQRGTRAGRPAPSKTPAKRGGPRMVNKPALDITDTLLGERSWLTEAELKFLNDARGQVRSDRTLTDRQLAWLLALREKLGWRKHPRPYQGGSPGLSKRRR